jgi:hypothetical protein
MRPIDALYWRARVLLARALFKIAIWLNNTASGLMPKRSNDQIRP